MRLLRSLLLLPALALAPGLYGQIVEESFARDPGALDFIKGEGLEQAILQSLTGDALVGLDAAGRPVPRLAASWTIRKSGLAFRLRPDARFADGNPVRLQDALWTLRTLQADPGASPTKRAVLEGVKAELQGGELLLRSPKPAARLLAELARVPIAREGHPELGSGPFGLARSGSEWTLTRRPHFLGPRIQGLHFRWLPDPEGALQALRKGWLSIGVPPPRAQQEPPPSHRLLVQPLHAQLVVWSRVGPGILRKLEACRRDAFPPHLLGAAARPSHGLWPETLGFEPMAVATDGPAPLSAELLYPAGDDFVQRLLMALRERARWEGLELRLQPVEAALLYERLQQGRFDLALAPVLFEPHPWAVLEYLEPQGPMNFTGWSHPDLPRLLAKLDAADAPAWRALQALWARNPGALPLVDLQSAVWVDRRLQVEPGPQGLYLSTPGAAGWTWRP